MWAFLLRIQASIEIRGQDGLDAAAPEVGDGFRVGGEDPRDRIRSAGASHRRFVIISIFADPGAMAILVDQDHVDPSDETTCWTMLARRSFGGGLSSCHSPITHAHLDGQSDTVGRVHAP